MNALAGFETPLPTAADLASLLEQVWASFIGEDLATVHLLEASDASEFSARDRVVASVSITGPWCGHLTIAASSRGAEEIASSMFEMPAAEMQPTEIADAFGEMANIAGGNVKAMLPQPSTLSLPQVIVEAAWVSLYSARLRGTAVMQWRNFQLDVSLWEATALKDNNSEQETDAA